jgi:hypothetical protein
MTTSIHDVLANSAEEALQVMFFTQVLRRRPANEIPIQASDGTIERPYLAVRLCFLGTGKTDSSSREPRFIPAEAARPGGHLDVEVSREGAQWIASSFLAADDGSVPPHRVADVICELTNVVCGSVMSNIASESGFSMLSPEVMRGSTAEWPHTACYEESFELERGWVTLRLGLASAS